MQNILIPFKATGYSFIDGKLESVVFERALLEVNDTETVLSYGLVLPNGSTTIVPFKNFYDSVNDFQNGKLAEKYSWNINWRKAGVRQIEPNDTIEFYSLGENGVEKTTATKYMAIYIAKTAEISIIGDNFPTKKYPSQRDLFENESFIISEDGIERTHTCIKELLQLDAAQDKAVDELVKALAKCRDLGVDLACDSANIVAFNTKKLKDFGIGYEGDFEYNEHTGNFFQLARCIKNVIALVEGDESLFFEREDEK